MAGFFFWYAVIFTWAVLGADYKNYKIDKKYMLIVFVISVGGAAAFSFMFRDLTLTLSWGK